MHYEHRCFCIFVAVKRNVLDINGGRVRGVLVNIRGVMVPIVGNRYGGRNQNLNEAVYISHKANILEKGINPTIISPAMDS